MCDKLLTGFDAPVEQVMYLDKPLRDHNLLQAMARTNRPFPEMGKKCGLIIDYFGVFNELEKALNFDEKVREEAVIDWQKLKEQVPVEVGKCMALLPRHQDRGHARLPAGVPAAAGRPEERHGVRGPIQANRNALGGDLAGRVPVPTAVPVQLAVRNVRRPPPPQSSRAGLARRTRRQDAAN